MTTIIIAIIIFGFIVFCIVGSGNHDREDDTYDERQEDISAVDEWLRRKEKEREQR